MGHSTVSFKLTGIKNQLEIESEFKKKREESRDQYGFEENPDSFLHASVPILKKHVVYTSFGLDKINLNNYESIAIYVARKELVETCFKKQILKINKLNDKIKKLNITIEKASTEAVNQFKLKKSFKIKMNCCESLINASAYHEKNGQQSPTRCPVCREEVLDWREKVYGSRYSKVREKTYDQIKKLTEEIRNIESQMLEINFSDLTKKELNMVDTLILADVHH